MKKWLSLPPVLRPDADASCTMLSTNFSILFHRSQNECEFNSSRIHSSESLLVVQEPDART